MYSSFCIALIGVEASQERDSVPGLSLLFSLRVLMRSTEPSLGPYILILVMVPFWQIIISCICSWGS